MPQTILFVDDSATMQQVAALTFAGDEQHLLTAANGAQAIQQTADRQPDLAVVDIGLPDLDGYTVCQRIAEQSAGRTAVLLMASQQAPIDEARLILSGAVGYVIKPFITQQLRQQVRDVLSRAASTAPAPSYHEAPQAVHIDYPSPPPPASPPPPVSAPISVPLPAGLDEQALLAMIRQMVEQVVWEIVPDRLDHILANKLNQSS